MRRVKRFLKWALENGFHLHLSSTLPHGRDDCRDLRRSRAELRIIFDVGANNGGSALKFHNAFPRATIHSFEPVYATFESLLRSVAHLRNVECHNIAFGNREGEAAIFLTAHSSTSSLRRPERPLGQERVRITTVDQFCSSNEIEYIDLLKVDAEGYDLEVLRGARGMLERGAVRFVLSEVCFHRDYSQHVPVEDVRAFLEPLGFRLFGIYDQQLEWSGASRLQYANACFAHTSIADLRSRS